MTIGAYIDDHWKLVMSGPFPEPRLAQVLSSYPARQAVTGENAVKKNKLDYSAYTGDGPAEYSGLPPISRSRDLESARPFSVCTSGTSNAVAVSTGLNATLPLNRQKPQKVGVIIWMIVDVTAIDAAQYR